MPGVSSISRYGPSFTHCLARVTPGRSEALATAEPLRRLMKVLFPTLGMPTTISRTVFFTPRAAARSTAGCVARAMRSSISLTRPPLELKRMAMTFFAR